MITGRTYNTMSGKNYSVGDVMSCFLGLVYGIFSFALVTPNIKAISEGRYAARMAFDIIERKAKINNDEEAIEASK